MKSKAMWDFVSALGKAAMCAVGGTTGVILVEKNDAVGAIIMGLDRSLQKEELVKTLRMFRERLDQVIDSVESGEVGPTQGDEFFMRDSLTGEYTKMEDEPE